jgi:multimeric flavodoxin WrbA
MKKVVAFNGSPRKNGNITAIVGEIIKGAAEAGAETKIYNLNEMSMKPCQGCFYCRGVETCAIQDDMKAVYEDLKEADAVVIGTPVYMFQVTAQTKLLFDRLYPLIDANFNPRFGMKKTVMVYSQGNPNADAFKQSFEVNATVLNMLGLQVGETIIAAGSNDSSTAANDKNLITKAFTTGEKLVQ